MSFDDVKREVAIGNRVLAYVGLCTHTTASLGHVSLRVPDSPDHFIVKGRGYEIDAVPAMKAADMIVCNLEGEKVDGPPNTTACYEVKIHSAIYKNYPDVKSVVHVHPPYAVLMSVFGTPLQPMGFGNSSSVPVWPHKRLVSSDADGEGVAALMDGYKVALLLGHGAVSTGTSIATSIMNMLSLEEQAKANYLALAAFGPNYPRLSDEMLKETADQPPWWELPHFKSSIAPGTDPRVSQSGVQGGPYKYWALQVQDGV